MSPHLVNRSPAAALIVGKSPGSLVSATRVAFGMPATSVTPLLDEPLVVNALRHQTAPFLWSEELVTPCGTGTLPGHFSEYLPPPLAELRNLVAAADVPF